MEHCQSCGRDFYVNVSGVEEAPTWWFHCPYCGFPITVENTPKIVWVLDAYSKTWHTKLVHKYTKPDGIKVMAFDYFE